MLSMIIAQLYMRLQRNDQQENKNKFLWNPSADTMLPKPESLRDPHAQIQADVRPADVWADPETAENKQKERDRFGVAPLRDV